jgi:hypothetical protein
MIRRSNCVDYRGVLPKIVTKQRHERTRRDRFWARRAQHLPQKYLNKGVNVHAVKTQKIATRIYDCLTPSACMIFPLYYVIGQVSCMNGSQLKSQSPRKFWHLYTVNAPQFITQCHFFVHYTHRLVFKRYLVPEGTLQEKILRIEGHHTF